METLKIVVGSGIGAAIVNILFYWIIKSRIDKSIEKYKIANSGIFKERIDIHKNLFSMVCELQNKLSAHVYNEISEEDKNEIKLKFNTFINYYLINQPFLSDFLINKLKNLNTEFQICYENLCLCQKGRNVNKSALLWSDVRDILMTDYFQPIQEEIILRMRNDM